jgi:hypothetical protein
MHNISVLPAIPRAKLVVDPTVTNVKVVSLLLQNELQWVQLYMSSKYPSIDADVQHGTVRRNKLRLELPSLRLTDTTQLL